MHMFGTSQNFKFSRLAGLKELKLHRDVPYNMDDLVHLTCLTKLKGNRRSYHTVISTLTTLKKLTTSNFHSQIMRDDDRDKLTIDGLCHLTNLVSLKICVRASVAPLSKLTNLRKLNLFMTEMIDRSFFKWTHVTHLTSWLPGIKEDASLTQLKKIWVSVTNTKSLLGLTNLTSLDLTDARVIRKFSKRWLT